MSFIVPRLAKRREADDQVVAPRRDRLALNIGERPRHVDQDGAVRWLFDSMPQAANRLLPLLHNAWEHLHMDGVRP